MSQGVLRRWYFFVFLEPMPTTLFGSIFQHPPQLRRQGCLLAEQYSNQYSSISMEVAKAHRSTLVGLGLLDRWFGGACGATGTRPGTAKHFRL